MIGVAGASAPIFNEHGTAFAAVGVAAPAQRSTPEQLEAWGPMAKKTGARISDLLGSPAQTGQ
jgi:DNA-binding IclR family transcriptional regulator